jgi:pyrimidine-nucleoside phosphorylase
LEEARVQAEKALEDGSGLEKFKQLVEAQGGDPSSIDSKDSLPSAPWVQDVKAPRSGCIAAIRADEVGLTAMQLGAGRRTKGEPVDHAVGIVLHRKVGDWIEQGDVFFTLHTRSEEEARLAAERLLQASAIQEDAREPLPLFYETFGGESGRGGKGREP